MTKQLLLPSKCRLIGSILLPFMITWLSAAYIGFRAGFPFLVYKSPVKTYSMYGPDFIFAKGFSADFNGELAFLGTLICLFMMAFSREKIEDEFVSAVRLRALQISVYANYLILAVFSVFIYHYGFVSVIFANIFTQLIIFICVLNYNLHIKSRMSTKARKWQLTGLVLLPLSMLNLLGLSIWGYRLPVFCKEENIRYATGGNKDTVYYNYTWLFPAIFVFLAVYMIAFSREKTED